MSGNRSERVAKKRMSSVSLSSVQNGGAIWTHRMPRSTAYWTRSRTPFVCSHVQPTCAGIPASSTAGGERVDHHLEVVEVERAQLAVGARRVHARAARLAVPQHDVAQEPGVQRVVVTPGQRDRRPDPVQVLRLELLGRRRVGHLGAPSVAGAGSGRSACRVHRRRNEGPVEGGCARRLRSAWRDAPRGPVNPPTRALLPRGLSALSSHLFRRSLVALLAGAARWRRSLPPFPPPIPWGRRGGRGPAASATTGPASCVPTRTGRASSP